MASEIPLLSVGDFVAITNQTLEYAYPAVLIEGEVDSFKVNQSKFVFFNIKDSGASVGCFMMLFQLKMPLEDGMKVVVKARPKLTNWGKFSLTVDAIRPSGEGSIKKSFDILKQRLEQEGLFAEDRKRSLPALPQTVAVISSVESAGYADFMKIVDDRWGGITFKVYHTQVQGIDAPQQIEQAVQYFNEQPELADVLVIIRGGGSADDLAAFNDEGLVRAVASSRIPVLTGIGHEVDETLIDFVADVRAATPSNAAQILTPDKQAMIMSVQRSIERLAPTVQQHIVAQQDAVMKLMQQAYDAMQYQIGTADDRVATLRQILRHYDPGRVLEQGYALVRGEVKKGSILEIETARQTIQTEVKAYVDKV